MSNPNANPTKARQAKRARRRTPGTLEEARSLLWRALERAGEMLEAQKVDPDTGEEIPDDALALKAVHAISQGASAYARIVEVGELEARIAALEVLTGSGPQLGKGAA